MSVTASFMNRADYLLVKSVGSVTTVDDIVDHIKRIYAETLKYAHKKFLINLVEVNRPKKLFYYYEVVQRAFVELPSITRSFIIALVMSEEYTELGKFLETTTLNRGFQCHVYFSEKEAHEWLVNG